MLLPRSIACLTLIIALTPVASAADFGTPYAPPSDRRPLDGSYRNFYSYDAPMTWTGLYAGAHGGWGTGSSDLSGPIKLNIDSDGFLGGLHAGYNFQYQSLVAGLEADLDWTSIEGSETSGGTQFDANANWLSSFRLRLGYAVNNFLIYGTGGLAVAGFDLTDGSSSLDNTMTGYAVGIGAEYAFTKSLIGRVEALHYGFGDEDFKISGTAANTDFDVTTVRAGLTLKLN